MPSDRFDSSLRSEAPRSRQITALTDAWNATKENAATYRALAEMETDSQRAHLLFGLAESEEKYATLWQTRLRELGANRPEYRGGQSGTAKSGANRVSGLDGAYRRTERVRERRLREYGRHLRASGDAASVAILAEVLRGADASERVLLNHLASSPPPRRQWFPVRDRDWRYANIASHAKTANRTVDDVLYGIHSGLTTVFALLGVVSGATARDSGGSRATLLAGLAGIAASSLSVSVRAYAAARTGNEGRAADTQRERATRETDPDEARRSLSLRYRNKGVPAPDADRLAAQIVAEADDIRHAGTLERVKANDMLWERPWNATFVGAWSSALGAFVPLAPFLLLHGDAAVFAATLASLTAFFAIGAARSVIVVRSWSISGLEASLFGALVGLTAYGIGRMLRGIGM